MQSFVINRLNRHFLVYLNFADKGGGGIRKCKKNFWPGGRGVRHILTILTKPEWTCIFGKMLTDFLWIWLLLTLLFLLTWPEVFQRLSELWGFKSQIFYLKSKRLQVFFVWSKMPQGTCSGSISQNCWVVRIRFLFYQPLCIQGGSIYSVDFLTKLESSNNDRRFVPTKTL